jgi:hypothetical protein
MSGDIDVKWRPDIDALPGDAAKAQHAKMQQAGQI